MGDTNDDAQRKVQAEALIPQFKLERVLNQDQTGRRISLLGTISDDPALITIERAALPTDPKVVSEFLDRLVNVKNLQWNDIYHWYLSSLSPLPPRLTSATSTSTSQPPQSPPADLKLNLIYPCTPQHVAKYTSQRLRLVTETPQIYSQHIRPYMSRCREEGRLNWVFNILDGKKEQEDVILRHDPSDPKEKDEGFLLLPDLNWDRTTLTSLHLLALVQRRDIWSLRDLKRKHIPWLRQMRDMILDTTISIYKEVERDELKLYIHYQPTYYHFHVHVVHVQCEAGATQSVGKAVGYESVLEQLQSMGGNDGDEGMDGVNLIYYLGERSELWEKVWGVLKRGEVPDV